jgi:hypothetical protein
MPVIEALNRAGIGSKLGDGMLKLAELDRTLAEAAAGVLTRDDERLKPISRHPDIWELRFEFGGHQFRMYFGEPRITPGHLVALHFHAKQVIDGDIEETNRLQNREIDVAAERFRDGERRGWPEIQA